MTALVLRRARLVLVATAVFTAVFLALGATAVPRMSGGTNQFEDPGSESVRAFDRLSDAAGEQPAPGYVLLVREGSPDDVRERLAAEPAIVRTAVRGDLVLGYLSRRDDRAVRGTTERLQRVFADEPGVLLGGGAVAAVQIADTVRGDLERAELIAFPLVFALSFLVFRGLVAALLPTLVGAASIAATFALMRVAVEVTGISVFALNLVTGLGFGLAIDYSLLMLTRYREELERHGPGAAPLAATLRTAGRTVAYSGLTVAAAMGSLLVFPQQFLRSMALGGTLVALAAAFISLVPLPALLHVLGPRVNALALRRWQASPSRGRWARLARGVMRRPALVAVTSAAVLVALGLSAVGVRFTGIDAGDLPPSSSARQVADELDARGLRGLGSPVELVLPSAPTDAELAAVRGLAGTAEVAPAVRVATGVRRLDVLPPSDPLDPGVRALVGDLRDAVPRADVTGQTAAFVDQQASLAAHLPWALAVLGSTTFVLLFLFTGSVVLPVKALVMNALTISGAIGVLVLVFQDALGADGIESTQLVLLSATAFGLSTDYAVFLLGRIKEARDRGLANAGAVADGLERTGRTVTAAALLFCVAIGTFSTSRLAFVQELGLGTAAAVLLDATIVRAFLVPSLMALLGDWNWWAPAPLRRLHERLGLGHG